MTDVTPDKSENQEEASALVAGPGRRLREAREARRLSIEQVATQLRMQARIIEALEGDDYSSLPGKTFVQGYLRSYSRLLGLPEESVVALASNNSEEPKLVSTITEGKLEATSSDLPMRMTSFLILIIVVVGMGWWLSQRSPVIDSQPPLDLPGTEQGLLLPEETLPLQANEEALVVGEEESVLETTDVTGEQAEVVAQDNLDPEQAESEPEIVEAPPVVIVAPTPSVAAAPVSALTPETPQSQLLVEYQADSWSEITDAAGRKLAYGIVPAGSQTRLQGVAPFKVFLGYARGVTIYYNDDLYDHSPYHRGDVARFRIGRADHNRPLTGN